MKRKDPAIPNVPRKHTQNQKSLDNLVPLKKGQVLNPWGRKGKSGTGGVSLKNSYQKFLNMLSPEHRQAIWDGLYRRACSGDATAIKLMVTLNGECPEFNQSTDSQAPQLTIVMPPKDTVSRVKPDV